jgi:hypothetical protein
MPRAARGNAGIRHESAAEVKAKEIVNDGREKLRFADQRRPFSLRHVFGISQRVDKQFAKSNGRDEGGGIVDYPTQLATKPDTGRIMAYKQ